jgi:hypothetical protein
VMGKPFAIVATSYGIRETVTCSNMSLTVECEISLEV